MFGGNISGEFVEVVPGKKLVQKWRLGGWAPEVFSTVTLEFLEGDSNTCTIKLTQVNIPAAELDRTKAGWDTFFWQRIRGLFGWSYKMM
jgi:activator of HSP90 ATPase